MHTHTHHRKKNRPSHPSTLRLFITLPVFLSLSHKQKYCMLLSQGYLFCVCVCVYPSGNSCPDGISSFREACNQLIRRCSSLKPRGQERRGEGNAKKGGGWARRLRELLWLFKLEHHSTQPHARTHAEPPTTCVRYWPVSAHMHISVRFVLQYMSLSLCPPASVSLSQCPCSTFLCLFHFVSGSYHQHRLLFSLGLRLQSDSVCLCSSLLSPTVSSE